MTMTLPGQIQVENDNCNHTQEQLQQVVQRKRLVNLAVPLNMFYGRPTLSFYQITYSKQ